MNNILDTLFDGPIFYVIVVWSLVWKGLALWRAAKNDSKIWYVILLILNTVGILEILYYFIFGKKRVEKPSIIEEK